ncbi:hypothetical protein CRG98_033511 [Punica granatum]|uniref:Uncharacterized protein n=1 Tax=Punica granatum TaxID=22663 RepID=A0A2I0IRQ1_PUNGR|nr:hypothetical protein CRG98_033511 [Punica granatum]
MNAQAHSRSDDIIDVLDGGYIQRAILEGPISVVKPGTPLLGASNDNRSGLSDHQSGGHCCHHEDEEVLMERVTEPELYSV